MPAARRFRPGLVRASDPGAVLRCLVLVPGPDWVLADLATGALMRPSDEERDRLLTGSDDTGVTGEGLSSWSDSPLMGVQLKLAARTEPADPARPESVTLDGPPVVLGHPRRRAIKRFLGHLVTKNGALLGTLGPSVSYSDLEGTRSSVVVVAPEQVPRFGEGQNGRWCQFLVGGRRHTLPWAGSLVPAPSSGRRPPLLVIGLGRPRRGQVPKLVLGAIPTAS